MRNLSIVSAFLVIVMCCLSSGCATPGGDTAIRAGSESATILVAGADQNPASVKRESAAFNRIQAAINGQLIDQGYAVYDEAAIGSGAYQQHKARRSEADIIEMARTIRKPPIDTLLVFTAYHDARTLPYTTKWRTRIQGQLLDLQSGQVLGNFELVSPTQPVSSDCGVACLADIHSHQAGIVAVDLGALVAEKLRRGRAAALGQKHRSNKTNQYSLIFEGFSTEEVIAIEFGFGTLSGYKTHRLAYSGYRRSEIWYEAQTTTVKLNKQLQSMLDEMDLKSLVRLDGNEFLIKRITLRRKKWVEPSADYEW
jgi:hypothetical protein